MMKLFLLLTTALLFIGCSKKVDGRWYIEERVTRGESLYNKYCVSCHQKDATGTKEWKKRDTEGFLPPPPLNGTAHTWHHDADLLFKIMDEGGSLYNGKMPPFKNVLSRENKLDILAYLQSFWSDETYSIWTEEIQKGKNVK